MKWQSKAPLSSAPAADAQMCIRDRFKVVPELIKQIEAAKAAE